MYASAIHESGHAVTGTVLGFTVREVAIRRSDSGVWIGWTAFDFGQSSPYADDGRPSGVTASDATTLPDRMRRAMVAAVREALGSDRGLLNYAAMSLAGRLAESKVTSQLRAAWTGDDDAASEALILEAMSREAAARAPNEARVIAENVLMARWRTVHTLALELVARGRLDGDDVRAIIETRKGATAPHHAE